MRKRITSLLLTLVMLLSLVPAMGVTASAADGFVEVSTYEELRSEVNKGSAKIKLTADIDTTSENSGVGVTTATNLSFKGSGNVLDLNGHKLKLVSNMSVYFIEILSSDLTIKDSGTNGRIDFEYGRGVLGVQRAVVISRSVGVKKAGSLTVDGGTLSSSYHGIILIESYGSITINGGRLYAPVSDLGNGDYLIHSTNRYDIDDTLQLHVNGGELDGRVVLKRDDSSATGTLKYKVTPIKITGGTFKQGLYATWKTWDSPEGEPKNAVMTMDSPTVEITGGVFEKNNEEYSQTASRLFIDLPTKLRGGTFKNGATIRFVGGKYTWDGTQPQYRASIGNSAILRGNDIRTAYGWSKSDWFEIQSPWIYLSPEGSSVTVIPNAWGMKSVTLDGNPIDYFKDWKGTVERMDNSTAHTIKFKWKDLAPELSAAGYSYNATCDRYISGSTTPTTDTISATDTEYSFTIDKDAPAKVYSFALHLNLKKTGSPYNVGIYSNEHIVKLVVNEAPVVEPDPTIEGTVYYTSGIVYGSPISIAASVTPAEATPAYQWQRSTDGGSTWTNIDGATSGKYTPVAADMGENVRIRVKITAEGYLGEIIGAALKVSKAANNNYPEVIQLEAVKDGAGTYTGFKITNFDSDCEYVYSTTSTPDWSANPITSATAAETGLTSNTTYYVFARFKETNTHTAGSIVSKNSIMLYDYVPLDRVSLEGYDSGNTIYIKQGESVTLKVSADPSNANYWNEITFKDEGATTSNIAISNGNIAASTGTATPFPNGHTITITGVSTGSANLRASYPSATSSAYGTWYVVVYDDSTVANALRLENVYAYEDITLSVNDEAGLPTDLPTLLPANSGYHLEWRILKRGTYGATYVTENDNIKLEDGKIKPKAAHAASEKAQLELVAVKDGSTEYKTLPKTSLFYVTVTAAPVIELTGLTVVPTKVNLDIDGSIQLSAVKEPVNAAGSLNWESSNTSVATVDSTGKVTAKAQGTAIITVSCGDKKATCTVTVDHQHDYSGQPYLYLDPGNHYQECKAGDGGLNIEAHTFGNWMPNSDGTTQSRICTKCKHTETAPISMYSVKVSTDGNGTAMADKTSAAAGTVVTLTATPKSGYTFKQWQVITGGVKIKDNKFTMPAGNVEVKAIFEKNATPPPAPTYYSITVTKDGSGTASASLTTAAAGTEITLTAKADAGYTFKQWQVITGGVTIKDNKFTMPAGNVEIKAIFEKNATPPPGPAVNPFVDVPEGSFYYDAVLWAVEKGVTTGTSATTFEPDGSCTRAQAVTFLWRVAGCPAPKSAAMPFTDVKAGSFYYDAVLWAVENGITKGTSETTFEPEGICTRAQIVTLIWRCMK